MATIPRQFRLTEDTLAELDALVRHLEQTTGMTCTRSDAVRFASRQTCTALNLSTSTGKKTKVKEKST